MSAAIMSQDETGSANLVEYLLRACPESLEANNIGGLAPLAVACWLGRLSLIKMLIAHDANQSTKDSNWDNIGSRRSRKERICSAVG